MVFPVVNRKIALVHVSMVVTYNIKLFCMEDDRDNGILMSLLILVTNKNVHIQIVINYGQQITVSHLSPFSSDNISRKFKSNPQFQLATFSKQIF